MKNLIKLIIEFSKTKEGKDLFRESFRKQTKELINPFGDLAKYTILGASVFSLYVGLNLGVNYIENVRKQKDKKYLNSVSSSLNKEGQCIKYVPRAGYFYCDTNKKVN